MPGRRLVRTFREDWSKHTRALAPLKVGDPAMDRDSKLFPAKPFYGRELRDLLPRPGSAMIGDMWPDEPGGCQVDGSGMQGQTFREEVV
jgi:hypothetical protein